MKTRTIPTSKDTSINRDKTPRIFTLLSESGVYGTNLFDIGCGKWTRHIAKYAKETGVCSKYYGYDPYNQKAKHNSKVIDKMTKEKYAQYGDYNPNVFVSSNVLNVIATYRARFKYIREILLFMKTIDELYITIYEGNRSGIGKETKRDCYQCNKTIAQFTEEVKRMLDGYNNDFGTSWTLRRTNGMIEVYWDR